jgi:hypothetical protein
MTAWHWIAFGGLVVLAWAAWMVTGALFTIADALRARPAVQIELVDAGSEPREPWQGGE